MTTNYIRDNASTGLVNTNAEQLAKYKKLREKDRMLQRMNKQLEEQSKIILQLTKRISNLEDRVKANNG